MAASSIARGRGAPLESGVGGWSESFDLPPLNDCWEDFTQNQGLRANPPSVKYVKERR